MNFKLKSTWICAFIVEKQFNEVSLDGARNRCMSEFQSYLQTTIIWMKQWGDTCFSAQTKLPNHQLLQLLANLLRCATSIIVQLLMGHVALNTFLKKVHAADSALCPWCCAPETVSHFLLHCSKFTSQCRSLHAKVGIASTAAAKLLGDTKCLSQMLWYISDMKHFKDYKDIAVHPTE